MPQTKNVSETFKIDCVYGWVNMKLAANITINVHYDSLLTVHGDVDKEVFPGVKKMCQETAKYLEKQWYKDAKLQGIDYSR